MAPQSYNEYLVDEARRMERKSAINVLLGIGPDAAEIESDADLRFFAGFAHFRAKALAILTVEDINEKKEEP